LLPGLSSLKPFYEFQDHVTRQSTRIDAKKRFLATLGKRFSDRPGRKFESSKMSTHYYFKVVHGIRSVELRV